MYWRSLFLVIIVIVVSACTNQRKETVDVDPVLLKELKSYILSNQKTPEEYIINKFAECDVVILGEQHRIKHDVELVGRLIPVLYENGIYTLATEFGRREDQALIDSLLSGNQWDEQLARLIMFNQFVHWGYREYVDIYRSAWELNRSLSQEERPFRILGMNDSPDWSFMKTQADREVDSLKRLVWKGGGEKFWAQVVLDRVDKGDKVLVFCGLHHGFSEYLQPIVTGDGKFIRFEEDRMGRYVFNAIGKRVITIFLHAMWDGQGGYSDDWVRPADGIIDKVMESLGERFKPIGFDIKGSPFGKLTPVNAVYRHGYEPFTLAKFCDGWIYLKPFKDYETVTWIDNFINPDNIDIARQQSPNPNYRSASIEDFELSEKRWLQKMQGLLRKL